MRLVCALCCQKRSTITACGVCQEDFCNECIDAVGNKLFFCQYMKDTDCCWFKYLTSTALFVGMVSVQSADALTC